VTRRPLLFLVIAIATVTIPVLAAPALAQTAPADASAAGRCAVAASILEQLPPAPTAPTAPAPATPTSVTLAPYVDTVLPGRGIETSAGTISGDTRLGASFIGEMAGDLPGVLISSVNYTPASPGAGVTNNIVGGEWALCGAWGTLFGTFTKGTVQWNSDETLANVEANMSLLGGSVNSVPVSDGAATFSGVLDHRPLAQGLPPAIGGTLQVHTSAASTTGGVLPGTGGPPLLLPITALLLIPSLLGLGILRRFT
jgi:hypothetical protein